MAEGNSLAQEEGTTTTVENGSSVFKNSGGNVEQPQSQVDLESQNACINGTFSGIDQS